jgi:manganese transport protein
VVALNGALLVNAAILVLAGAVFFKHNVVVTEIQQAYQLLTPLLGTTVASVLFGVALLCSGQSSTMTGTMAGQIVMEGFLSIRMRPWLRRLTTRLIAIVPAAITVYIAGEQGTFRLLILSQVILSMQLPFAVVPLIHFTNDRARMGTFANRRLVKALAWTVAAIIVALNIRLVYLTIGQWLAAAGPNRDLVMMLVEPVLIGLLLLLAWMIFEPWLPGRLRVHGRAAIAFARPAPSDVEAPAPHYRTILVPLDHTERDRSAVAHAAAMARAYGAKIYLLHVEEDVTSQVYGSLASTAEVQAGKQYLEKILDNLRSHGIEVEVAVAHSSDPKHEIIRFARELKPDLVIMGAHGHKGIQDIVYGQTINAVRHALDVPLLIVRNDGTAT